MKGFIILCTLAVISSCSGAGYGGYDEYGGYGSGPVSHGGGYGISGGGGSSGFAARSSQQQQHHEEHHSSSQSQQFAQGGQYGGAGGFGGGSSGSFQQSHSHSSSFRSSSFSSQTVHYNFENEWPNLYKVPFFRDVCNLGSGVKSAGITQKLIGGRNDFNFYGLFDELYKKNNLIEKYIFATTGIRARGVVEVQNFADIVKRHPAGLLRSISLFARHPNIFKSKLVDFTLNKKSREIVQIAAQHPNSVAFNQYQNSFNEVLRSKHYRQKFAQVLHCEESRVFQEIQTSYQRNSAGTLLMVKHVITRRELYKREQYTSVDYNSYGSQNSVFRNKNWRHNQYYKEYRQTSTTTTTTSTEVANVGSHGIHGHGHGHSIPIGGSDYPIGGGSVPIGAGNVPIEGIGGVSGVHGVSGIGGGGFGGYGRGIGGRSRQVQQTVQETVHETEHQAESASSAVAAGGVGIGGGAVSGQHYQGQKSSSRTVTRTTTTTINYQEQWPQLYQEPLFQEICNLESNYRSQQISSRFMGMGSKYNYQSIFTNLYQRNQIFQQYMYAATGFQGTEYDSGKFFGLVNQNPGSLLRMVSLFAKHPAIYKNTVAGVLFKYSSYELLNYRSFTPNFFDDDYLIALTSSQTYRKLFSAVFSCGLDAKTIRSRLRRSFQRNRCGTLLLVRHVLTRRALFSFDDYMGVNYSIYGKKKHYWGKKTFKHNSYFSKYFLKRGLKRHGSMKLAAKKGGKIGRLQSKLYNNDNSS